MKRVWTLFIVAALLLSMAGCGQSGEAETGTEPVQGETEAVEPVETEVTDESQLGFAREDNGGKTFTILGTTNKQYEFDAEEASGDVVTNAVYERNLVTEEYLGIDFAFVYQDGGWNERSVFNKTIEADVMAGGTYDLVSAVTVCTISASMDGIFAEGRELPHVQFDQPWWVADMYERFSVNGSLYGFIGDACLSLYKDMTVIYFNKRIWENYSAPDPYELVRSNQWTLDKFIEISSGMSVDLNGDGKYDAENDQLTFLGEMVPCGTFQTALELEVVKVDGSGIPEYLGLTEKFVTAYEKLYTFMQTPGNIRMTTIDDQSFRSMLTFAAGNVATMCNFIYATEYLRDMEDDFGIVPMPKYDEKQEKYIAQLGTSTSMLFVPTTTKDIALTSKVMEVLSYFTSDMVVPQYYEVALKEKYARDTDIQEMLDIIRAGASFDFLFVYGAGCLKNAPNSYFRFTDNKKVDLASSFASGEKAFTASIQALSDAYAKFAE